MQKHNRRQKVFNRGVLRFFRGAWGQKLYLFIVFHISIWGGVEVCLEVLSLPKNPCGDGIVQKWRFIYTDFQSYL